MSSKIYGCDTETYNQGGTGLLSIQLYGKTLQKIFSYEEWMDSYRDEEVRELINKQFLEFLESSEEDMDIYFFNLKFDFSQFEKYLVWRYGETEDYYVRKGQRSIVQSPLNVYDVTFRTKKKGRLIRMRDLANITGSSLNKTCESFLGKDFQKIEIESKDFSRHIMTDEQNKYAMRDAELTYLLACKLKDVEGFNLLTKMTIGSRSLSLFRDFIKGKIPTSIMGIPVDIPIMTQSKDIWEHFHIEEKDIDEIEKYLRNDVKGGVCQAWHTGEYIGNCIHLDEHSAHPSQMVKKSPYGPLLHDKPDCDYTSVVFPKGSFKLVYKGLPCVQWRTKAQCLRYQLDELPRPGDYVKSFYLDGSFGIWKDELYIIMQNYQSDDYQVYDEVFFKTRYDYVLIALVNVLFKGKQLSKGAARNVFKLLLNALYGKFLTNPEGKKIEYIDDNGQLVRKEVSDGGRKPVYLPLGSWIAMMSRVTLLEGCIKVGIDNLLYSDTDSIIFKEYKGWENDFTVGEKLGDWGFEKDGHPIAVNIIGPKTYQEVFKEDTITKCAGLPLIVSSKIPFGELKEGNEYMKNKAVRNRHTLAINIEPHPHKVSCRAQLYRGGH